MALSKDGQPFYPLNGYLALNDATPVCYVDTSYYAKEPLTLEVRNRTNQRALRHLHGDNQVQKTEVG